MTDTTPNTTEKQVSISGDIPARLDRRVERIREIDGGRSRASIVRAAIEAYCESRLGAETQSEGDKP